FWAAVIDDDDPVAIMPDWWSPTHRFFVANDDGDSEAYATLDEAECSESGKRVWTVNLETGEEVPA
ncbi:MAG: hypothetical protein ACYDBH_24505, partial [Acidobacteriaceae bacterium]